LLAMIIPFNNWKCPAYRSVAETLEISSVSGRAMMQARQ
jgi:hypothetical protein